MQTLTPTRRRALKAQAHPLQPVVMIGDAGLTPTVVREVDANLRSHELIKIRVLGDDRLARKTILETLCTELGAASVQHIGKVLVIYRQRPSDEPVARKKNTPKARTNGEKAPRKPRSVVRGKPLSRRTKRSFQKS
jgi:putative YhbY family RNA-binding protein